MNKKEILNKKGEKRDCASAVIFKDEKVLMGQRRYCNDLIVWICPGGRCNKGELIGDALIREVEEEIGVDNLEILDYIESIKGSYQDDIVHVFLCSIDSAPVLMEPEKFLKWSWFSIKEIPKNSLNRERIIDILKNKK